MKLSSLLFKDVVDSHAGLAFLKEASDFHSRYITTVRLHTIAVYKKVVLNFNVVLDCRAS